MEQDISQMISENNLTFADLKFSKKLIDIYQSLESYDAISKVFGPADNQIEYHYPKLEKNMEQWRTFLRLAKLPNYSKSQRGIRFFYFST